MDKNNKVLLSIFVAVAVFGGAAMALLLDAFIRVPDFSGMRSKVVVPIKLADKSWTTKEMGPKAAGWVGAKAISNPMFMAVIASEDTSFFSHQGIDYHELRESIKKDWEEKRWARGASTITQQVIKNVYLGREKSVWRKFKELIWAREIEKVLTKTEILTFYLNMAEWGPNLYGIRAASNHYFGVSPAELTAKQSAFLAMLLPSPIKYHSYFLKKELTPFARSRVGKILRVMQVMGFLDEEQYREALKEKLWGVTGELPVYKDGEAEPDEDSDSSVFTDVLKETEPSKAPPHQTPEVPPKSENPSAVPSQDPPDILQETEDSEKSIPSDSTIPHSN